MLYFVVVLSILSACFAEGDEKTKIRLPEPIVKFVLEAASNCVKETNVNQDISDNFFKLQFENNEDTKKFMYCFFRKTNYSDEDGRFNESVMTLFEGSDRKDEVQKVIDNCNSIKEKDSMETMFKIFTCVYNKSPVLLSL